MRRPDNPNIMKRALSLVSFIATVLSGAWADVAPLDSQPEFFYTRVIYSGVGRGGFGFRSRPEPLTNFKCSDLARGEGGFGGGWITDYPAADCKFMWGVERLTGISVYREAPHPMELMDPNL